MEPIVISEYKEISEQIDVVRDTANFLPDMTTKDGYEASKRVSLDIGKLLTALEKMRKERKAFYLEGGKQVDKQAKDIAEQLQEIQLPHKEAYKEIDRLKKEREAQRVANHENRIEHMRSLSRLMAESSSEEIQAALQDLQKEECLDFEEFTNPALKVRNTAIEEMGALLSRRIQEEKDAADLARLRQEQEERERQEREEAIRKEAAERAEREKQEAIERAEREKQEAAERERRAIEEKEAAERARIEAEQRAKEQAEQAAEQARLAEIQRQKEEREKAEAEAAKREADKAHISKIRREAKECLMAFGIDEFSARTIVLALHNGHIAHCKIIY